MLICVDICSLYTKADRLRHTCIITTFCYLALMSTKLNISSCTALSDINIAYIICCLRICLYYFSTLCTCPNIQHTKNRNFENAKTFLICKRRTKSRDDVIGFQPDHLLFIFDPFSGVEILLRAAESDTRDSSSCPDDHLLWRVEGHHLALLLPGKIHLEEADEDVNHQERKFKLCRE